jgi:anti-sigma B factor antagonist
MMQGELDLASCQVLEDELAQLEAAELVVIDLRQLEFIDSTGLGAPVRAHQRAQELGHRVVLVRGNGQVERLLNLTGLEEQLLLVDSPDELQS